MTYAALIYSHSLNPRLHYITDFLSRYYKLAFKLTSDEQTYLRSDIACKINYSYHRLAEGEIWIHSHALLFESAVHPVKVDCFRHHDYVAFFRSEGEVGFDLFAAIFYLITRYEEYLPHKKDGYGRYAHENALAFREGFLQLPLINIWLEDVRNLLAEKDLQFATPKTKFNFQPTYDIDIAWNFRNKGFKRTAGGLLKLFLSGQWRSLSQRVAVLRKKRQDPFDAYEWMDELHSLHQLNPLYFFLVAQHRGKYDKNSGIENLEFQQLIQALASKYKVGLHPSWASGDEPSLLMKEKSWFEKTTQQAVNLSRQHYIRFDLPETYRRLVHAGITDDYSMGYGSINGFRASIATPFYWYDLKQEEATNLLIHPFCFMDANSYYEQKQSPEEALQEMLQYYRNIQSVNGQMITIWHNNFLGTSNAFEGWREVYRQFVATIAESAT